MIGEKEKKVVYVGADHAGFESKEKLRTFLAENGFQAVDLGCFTTDSCDYPDIASEVAEKVLETPGSFGVLICGSGIGMEIAANRFNGIRAAHVNNEADAEMSRKHNNANVISFGSRTTTLEDMEKYALKFLNTDFESGEERHVRRVQKMDNMGENV